MATLTHRKRHVRSPESHEDRNISTSEGRTVGSSCTCEELLSTLFDPHQRFCRPPYLLNLPLSCIIIVRANVIHSWTISNITNVRDNVWETEGRSLNGKLFLTYTKFQIPSREQSLTTILTVISISLILTRSSVSF